MSSSALIEVFGQVVLSFTRGVSEHYNPEEPEFTDESFGYNPLESTGREWYYQPVDELIYQEYSDREATSFNYLTRSSLNVRVIDASAPEENKETRKDKRDDETAMAWKRLRPSIPCTVCKSMYVAALISLLTGTFVGTIYVLISYLRFRTEFNCQFQNATVIPKQVQWVRSITGMISACVMFFWYFANLLFLFRPFQLMGLKGKLFFVCIVTYFLDVLYRFALQTLSKSGSFISVKQKIPLNVLFLISACLQVYLVVNHLCTRSRKEKLTLSFQFMVPGSFCFVVFFIVAYVLYPAYSKQDKDGKLLIAVFAPVLGVVFKVISRICVQQMYNVTHPGYSYVLLSPLYFGSAVVFRALQADLHGLQFIALLGIIHGVAEVIERTTMVLVDHICHTLWKRQSAPWGSFRTPRRERLMADITILSMWCESAAIVSSNGLVYVYQFVYLRNIPIVELLEAFAIHTSVQLVIEWFFTAMSLAIQTRYENVAVMAVWQRRWKRHVLVAIVNVVPLTLATNEDLLVVVHAVLNGTVNQNCKMPFSG